MQFHQLQTLQTNRSPVNDPARATEFDAIFDPTNEMSLGLVFRDIELASSNGVSGTPTVFINGHRVEGVRDAAQLSKLISEAQKELPERESVGETATRMAR